MCIYLIWLCLQFWVPKLSLFISFLVLSILLRNTTCEYYNISIKSLNWVLFSSTNGVTSIKSVTGKANLGLVFGPKKIASQLKALNGTRLTHICAHLRLNNKKNKNKSSQEGLQDWALIFVWFGHFLGWNFLGEIFLAENFFVENFFG